LSVAPQSNQDAADVLGVSGRLMLHALAEGEENVERLVELARGSLKSKSPSFGVR